MAGPFPSQLNQGSFVPTTSVWDVNQIYETEVGTPEFTELLVRLYQNINNIAVNLNLKDIGYYVEQEFLNGQKFFSDSSPGTSKSQTLQYRQVFRTVVNFGALPNNTTKSVPHGIQVTQQYSFTRIYGTASNSLGGSFLPIPYASSTAGRVIELSVDATNVHIITGSDMTAYTSTYIVLEYIKQ